ncbi:N-acetylmuramoyl-L-alanine amidase [Pontibacter silvestris]|uniref:N-acetylmuramoyl-L-alanine amidase n=1 Tax=Pontibacter silvestris TaxID=2305183 RepID=A0ABW4WZZ8_9BACT|nr:N-acetylmuramoyl-L-alanine amidase [Pontibacter silvestris]MCC9136757.1 N-acetylmuramoyl-L-alanine amidase [Pontibacter silvestris]
MRNYLLVLILIFPAFFCSAVGVSKQGSPLTGKTICVDAGHGGTAQTDSYRVGPAGEREEWINLRVALLLQKMLEKKGAKVLMTRVADDNVPFDERVALATDNRADVFVSIHHNATADPTVNFPIIYLHGSATENAASVALGKQLAKSLTKHLYQNKTPVSLVSDHTIFPTAGAKVLRDTYGIPGVIAEASFFTNPAEETRLQQNKHNRQEALAYATALEAFFRKPHAPVVVKGSKINIPPFKAFQEAERMNETALRWHQDFMEAKALMEHKDTASMHKAYELFTQSACSFPDSYVAAQCHQNRAALLVSLGKANEAKQEKLRAEEYYVELSH